MMKKKLIRESVGWICYRNNARVYTKYVLSCKNRRGSVVVFLLLPRNLSIQVVLSGKFVGRNAEPCNHEQIKSLIWKTDLRF
jgi:hypothetical protein